LRITGAAVGEACLPFESKDRLSIVWIAVVLKLMCCCLLADKIALGVITS
jgi:hypothetical protein